MRWAKLIFDRFIFCMRFLFETTSLYYMCVCIYVNVYIHVQWKALEPFMQRRHPTDPENEAASDISYCWAIRILLH